jgi:hypothetical protein
MHKITVTLAILLLFAGCAHSSVDEQLDKKLADESGVNSSGELKKETKADLLKAKNITPGQKAELEKLRQDFAQSETAIYQRTLKLRAVLVKDMVAVNYNEAEVRLIQDRMRDLEDKRLTLQFAAIDRANHILGHDLDEDILNDYFEPNLSHNGALHF